jgi:mono/diheme cytochrome c family protein
MKIPAALKIFTLTIAAIIVAAMLLIVSAPARTIEEDSAALYRAKCAACHGATAEKKFDATKPDAELVETILKGKKAEKPPNMPAYGDKGITEDQAKALAAYMKTLRQ